MKSYIPGSDIEFVQWAKTFSAYVNAHDEHLGVPADVTIELIASVDDWEAKYDTHVSAQTAARVACGSKDAGRKDLEAFVRPLVKQIQANSATTDDDRRAMGITVPGTALAMAGEPLEETPLAVIDISKRQKHIMRIDNNTSGGIRKAKPAGALGAEVYVKVGEAPSGVSDMRLVGIATKSKFEIEYPDDEAGKQAYYQLRWVTSAGEKGSWSEVESATIAA
jgi:hypothetical protein